MGLVISDQAAVQIRERVASRQPGLSLEQSFYNDPEIFDFEIERIFKRYWLYAGHVSQIPARGDYFICEVAGESIIIIRDNNLQICALYNVCRHRGSRICAASSGKVKSLVCPYHQWTYRLDGSLLAARHMPEEFDKAQF